MRAMPNTWDAGVFSPGIKSGSKEKATASRFSSAATKQKVMLAVNTSAIIFSKRTACRSRFMHSSPVSKMAVMVSNTSPRYTS